MIKEQLNEGNLEAFSVRKLESAINTDLSRTFAILPHDSKLRVPKKAFQRIFSFEFLSGLTLTARPNASQFHPQTSTVSDLRLNEENEGFEKALVEQRSLLNRMEFVMKLNKDERKQLLLDSAASMVHLDKIADKEVKSRIENVKTLQQNLEKEITLARDNFQFDKEKENNIKLRVQKMAQRSKELQSKLILIYSKLKNIDQERLQMQVEAKQLEKMEELASNIHSFKEKLSDVRTVSSRNGEALRS